MRTKRSSATKHNKRVQHISPINKKRSREPNRNQRNVRQHEPLLTANDIVFLDRLEALSEISYAALPFYEIKRHNQIKQKLRAALPLYLQIQHNTIDALLSLWLDFNYVIEDELRDREEIEPSFRHLPPEDWLEVILLKLAVSNVSAKNIREFENTQYSQVLDDREQLIA